METNENIIIKLNQLNANPSEINQSLFQYLIKIEEIFNVYEIRNREATYLLKKSSPSLTDIANIVGCSRTTFYNHDQLLKRYIELSVNTLNSNNPFFQISKLEELYHDSKDKYFKLISRDIKYQLLERENEKLVSELNNQKEHNNKLNIQISNLLKKCTE